MADPLKLAAAAIEFGVARYGNLEMRRTGISLALKILGIACAGAGGGFAVAALLVYLIPVLGAAGATLVVAGVLAAIGALSAGVGYYLSRPSRGQEVARRPDLQSMVADVEAIVRQNKALVLATAFIAGMLAAQEGSRPRQD